MNRWSSDAAIAGDLFMVGLPYPLSAVRQTLGAGERLSPDSGEVTDKLVAAEGGSQWFDITRFSPRMTGNANCGPSREPDSAPIVRPKGRQHMAENNSGPEEGIKGVVEDVKGKAKETVGTVTGRDDMVREGKAQQDKADAQRDVAQKEAEAESARAGAAAAEKRQEANQ